VSGGFVQVEGDRVSVLAEFAMREEQIDEAAVQKAVERAQESLRNREKLDDTEVDRLEGVLRFAVVQMSLKKRKS